ncbi:MAG: Hpt domain-containing protein [Fibrobacteres bacterium]|nr:Hpt domain-containing protein [Fibrobacterota bacterium]
MNLRTKTILMISATLVILVSILYTIIRTIVTGGFREVGNELTNGFSIIEERNAVRNVERVTDALNLRIDGLATKVSDWAMWDDTYYFVNDHNKAYIESNISIDALAALDINGIIILNKRCEKVLSLFIDIDAEDEKPLPENLVNLLNPKSILLNLPAETSVVSGIIVTSTYPLMVVARPIVKSDGKGPINGTMLFVRYLDDSEFNRLSSVTHLDIKRFDAGIPDIPNDFRKADSIISKTGKAHIVPISNDTISGYTTIKDINNAPALLVRVDTYRDIHKQGNATLSQMNEHVKFTLLALVASIIIIGIILGLVIIVLLNKSVISRVAGLAKKTIEIGNSGNVNSRVTVSGKDEITTLASSINKMLSDLAVTHNEISARNAEMKLLMKTIPAGLLSLDENYNVNPEHSSYASSILGKEHLASLPYVEILGLTGSRVNDGINLIEFLDIMRQELTSETTIASLNPFEELDIYLPDGTERWIAISYHLIRRGKEKSHHILVLFRDITEEKKLAAEVIKSNRENIQLKAIAEDPDLFREFLVETRHILDKVELMAAEAKAENLQIDTFRDISRGIHTIKGVAGSFGLAELVDLSGDLEDYLAPFLDDENAFTSSELDSVRESIAKLRSAFNALLENTRRFVDDEIDGTSGILLKIPLRELKRYQADIESMDIEDKLKGKIINKIKHEALHRIRQLQNVPAKKGLARSLKIVNSLKERLGKSDAEFRIIGENTPINAETCHELNTPLIHLIRNAFDHGIEKNEERKAAGKNEAALVTLSIFEEDQFITIKLADDGRGINCKKVVEKAIRSGICTEAEAAVFSKEQCYALLFHPGFTTRDTVSDISGRGVGMDAVMHSVRDRLKGEVIVESELGKGSVFTLKIPLNNTFYREEE